VERKWPPFPISLFGCAWKFLLESKNST
jgi:hypothetical protein